MYLEKLTLEKYRLFESVTVDFHKHLTVLTGDSGVGKTTILEGASAALSTIFVKMDNLRGYSIKKSDAHLISETQVSNTDMQAQYPIRILARGSINGEMIEWSRCLNTPKGSTTYCDAKELLAISERMQKRLRQGDTSLRLPLIAYYGAARSWSDSKKKKARPCQVNSRTNGYINCLDGSVDLQLMMAWFQKMTIQKYQRHERGLPSVPELDAVYQAMKDCFACLEGFQNANILYSLNKNELEICSADDKDTRIALSQLSAEYKEVIEIVADIAYRMATLNPQLLDRTIKETEGIVLIDEFGAYLQSSLQKHIVTDLLHIFPQIQFIISSNSSEIINSVSNGSIVELKRRSG